LLIVDFLLKVGSGGFSAMPRHPLKTVKDASLYDSNGLVLTPAENLGRKWEIFGRIGRRF
jgi:hypothetical protein